MSIWFTADLHLGHENIIRYSNRPFNNLSSMNKILIDNWNSKIQENDTVYFLGDLSLWKPEKYLDRLNGKITFILGNHEFGTKHGKEKAIETVNFIKNHPKVTKTEKSLKINIDGYEICLEHFPNNKDLSHFLNNKIFLHGHSHGKKDKTFYNVLDVGVDTNNYFPYHWDDIKSIISNKPVKFPVVDTNPKFYTENTIMDFGKYKGYLLKDIYIIDKEYIKWCIDNVKKFKEKSNF